jgi:hypothetical protein
MGPHGAMKGVKRIQCRSSRIRDPNGWERRRHNCVSVDRKVIVRPITKAHSWRDQIRAVRRAEPSGCRAVTEDCTYG